MNKSRFFCVVTAGLASSGLMFLFSAAAQMQTVKPYTGEIIMTASGEFTGDWKEVRVCKDRAQCVFAVINMKTREGARLGDRWASKFEQTGNGKEVRRAETALAKSIRVQGAPAKPRP